MISDLISDGITETNNYVVCGFFTENYLPLAERLAAELKATNNPYHLFGREKGTATWRQVVRWKPEIVLEAMEKYPHASIILLDADSSVKGSLAPMLDFIGDISARAKMRLTPGFWPLKQKTVIHISSRSMVFKQSARTRKFLEDWRDELKTAKYYQGGCEMAMRLVIMRSVGLAFCPMDPLYSGIEDNRAPDGALVVHSSFSAQTGRN